MNNVLITGGGRGIGLQICQQLRDNGANVYAAVRKPSAAIAALGINVITDIDVADGASVSRLTSELAGVRLDLLLNNAGLLTRESFDDLDYARILRQFEVNALGPLRVVEALQANLGEGAKVGIITSRVGSARLAITAPAATMAIVCPKRRPIWSARISAMTLANAASRWRCYIRDWSPPR